MGPGGAPWACPLLPLLMHVPTALSTKAQSYPKTYCAPLTPSSAASFPSLGVLASMDLPTPQPAARLLPMPTAHSHFRHRPGPAPLRLFRSPSEATPAPHPQPPAHSVRVGCGARAATPSTEGPWVADATPTSFLSSRMQIPTIATLCPGEWQPWGPVDPVLVLPRGAP